MVFEYLCWHSWSYFYTCLWFFVLFCFIFYHSAWNCETIQKNTIPVTTKAQFQPWKSWTRALGQAVLNTTIQSQTKLLPHSSSLRLEKLFCCHEICWKANYSTEFHWDGELQRKILDDTSANKKIAVLLGSFPQNSSVKIRHFKVKENLWPCGVSPIWLVKNSINSPKSSLFRGQEVNDLSLSLSQSMRLSLDFLSLPSWGGEWWRIPAQDQPSTPLYMNCFAHKENKRHFSKVLL